MSSERRRKSSFEARKGSHLPSERKCVRPGTTYSALRRRLLARLVDRNAPAEFCCWRRPARRARQNGLLGSLLFCRFSDHNGTPTSDAGKAGVFLAFLHLMGYTLA